MDPIGTTAALWLNCDGKRYSNEGFGSTELTAMPGAYQPEGFICTVFDSNIEEQMKAQPLSLIHIFPGLYASGNTCGRRYGDEYITPIFGVSLGMVIVLGRECGKSVANWRCV